MSDGGPLTVANMPFPDEMNQGSAPVNDLMKSMFGGLPLLQDLLNQSTGNTKGECADDGPSQSVSSQSDRLSSNSPPNSDPGAENDNPNGIQHSKQNGTNGKSNSERNAALQLFRDSWFQCFSTQSYKELEALVYSLFAVPYVEKKGDGFEHYECVNRAKFKCRFRLRVKRINEWFIVEEKGNHSHSADLTGVQIQGLAKSVREIVDQSFHEEWSIPMRNERIEKEMTRLGLPHNPRLNRQIDNRISYLRRVKNLGEMKKIQEEQSSDEPMDQLMQIAVNNMMNVNCSPVKQPLKQENHSNQGTPNKNSQFDFNAVVAQMQRQAENLRSPIKEAQPQQSANGASSQTSVICPSPQKGTMEFQPTKVPPNSAAADAPTNFNAILAQLQQQTSMEVTQNISPTNADFQSVISSFLAQNQTDGGANAGPHSAMLNDTKPLMNCQAMDNSSMQNGNVPVSGSSGTYPIMDLPKDGSMPSFPGFPNFPEGIMQMNGYQMLNVKQENGQREEQQVQDMES